MLNKLLQHAYEKSPNKAALVNSNTSYTYSDLYKSANAFSANLLEMGLKQGDRVVVCLPASYEHVIIILGCIQIGLILVPINYLAIGNNLLTILEQVEPKLIFTTTCLYKELSTLRSFNLKSLIYFTDSKEGKTTFSALLKPLKCTLPELDETQPCYILHTSGSTGKPKGSVHTLKSIYYNSITIANTLKLKEGDIALTRNLDHISAIIAILFPMLYKTGTTVLVQTASCEAAYNAIINHKVSYMFATPSLWFAIAEQAKAKQKKHSLRIAVSGADTLHKNIYDAFITTFKIPLYSGIGMSETGVYALLTPSCLKSKNLSVGKLLPEVSAKVIDNKGIEVEANEAGELLIKSPRSSMKCYWRNELEFRELVRDGWTHTGDIIKLGKEGYLYFIGRKKDIIISGGSNIAPSEIENLLLLHPNIEKTAVVGVYNHSTGENDIVAVIQLRTKTILTKQEVIEFLLKNKLSRLKLPKRCVFQDSLPITPREKVDKKAILKNLEALLEPDAP